MLILTNSNVDHGHPSINISKMFKTPTNKYCILEILVNDHFHCLSHKND
jgi:hypothetical protein